MRRFAINLALAVGSLGIATVARAEDERVIVVSSERSALTERVASELRSMGLLVQDRVTDQSEDKPPPTSEKEDAVIVRVTAARVEIWSLRSGKLRFEEAVTRSGGIDGDVDASTVSAERVRARVLLLPHKEAPAASDDSGAGGGKFLIEASAQASLQVVGELGGDAAASCNAGCSSPVGAGARASGSLGARMQNGIGIAATLGYLGLSKSYRGRAAEANPIGFAPHLGTSNDRLSLTGPFVGGIVSYERGSAWKVRASLGLGVHFVSARVERDAFLFTSPFGGGAGTAYAVNGIAEEQSATVIYINPEVRMSRALGRTFRAFMGIDVVAMSDLQRIAWQGSVPFHAGECPNMDANKCQGLARLKPETPFSSFALSVGPLVGVSADF